MITRLGRLASAMGSPVAWIGVTALVQLVTMATGLLVNGDYEYAGASNAGLVQLGLEFYGRDLGVFLSEALVLNLGIALSLGAPFFAVYRRLGGWRRGRANLFAAAVAAGVFVGWIALAALRLPTLFAEIYYGDGNLLTARVFGAFCSVGGLITLSLAVLGALVCVARWTRLGVAIGGSIWYAILGATLWWSEATPSAISLPSSSVVLLMADSLRFDYFAATSTPEIFDRYARFPGAKFVARQVVPPLPRTAPSVVSLLTGKLPAESGVTTMFSRESTFGQRGSIVETYAAAGYCTLVVGDYPAEFFRKINFGFDQRDVPIARFREIFLQAVLKKTPFTLATLSWARLRLTDDARDVMVALPEYAGPGALGVRLKRLARKCGDRPVFAFVFADQPHFPYVQTWPHYLDLDARYRGPYKFGKDAVSAPRAKADKDRIRALYAASLRASDAAFGDLIDALAAGGVASAPTVVVTGDHGECLYDGLDIMGHGDQIGDLGGVAVPWIVLGAEPGRLAGSLDRPLSQIHLAPWLAAIRGLPSPSAPALEIDEVYIETGLWMADTPNVPRQRIFYPDLSRLLEINSRDGHMVLKERFAPIVELAKQRTWILDGIRYDVQPLPDRFVFFKNGVETPLGSMDPRILKFLGRYHPRVARAVSPLSH